jgi:hypothetical protein
MWWELASCRGLVEDVPRFPCGLKRWPHGRGALLGVIEDEALKAAKAYPSPDVVFCVDVVVGAHVFSFQIAHGFIGTVLRSRVLPILCA